MPIAVFDQHLLSRQQEVFQASPAEEDGSRENPRDCQQEQRVPEGGRPCMAGGQCARASTFPAPCWLKLLSAVLVLLHAGHAVSNCQLIISLVSDDYPGGEPALCGLPAVRQPSHVGSALLCIILPSPLPHYVLCSAGKPVLAWHPAVCSLLPCMEYCYWLGFSQAPPCTGANVLAGSSMH